MQTSHASKALLRTLKAMHNEIFLVMVRSRRSHLASISTPTTSERNTGRHTGYAGDASSRESSEDKSVLASVVLQKQKRIGANRPKSSVLRPFKPTAHELSRDEGHPHSGRPGATPPKRQPKSNSPARLVGRLSSPGRFLRSLWSRPKNNKKSENNLRKRQPSPNFKPDNRDDTASNHTRDFDSSRRRNQLQATGKMPERADWMRTRSRSLDAARSRPHPSMGSQSLSRSMSSSRSTRTEDWKDTLVGETLSNILADVTMDLATELELLMTGIGVGPVCVAEEPPQPQSQPPTRRMVRNEQGI